MSTPTDIRQGQMMLPVVDCAVRWVQGAVMNKASFTHQLRGRSVVQGMRFRIMRALIRRMGVRASGAIVMHVRPWMRARIRESAGRDLRTTTTMKKKKNPKVEMSWETIPQFKNEKKQQQKILTMNLIIRKMN